MKKLLLLCLVALLGPAFVRAQSGGSPSRADLVTRVETCEAILYEFQKIIPSEVLHNAHGLLILNQFKAGFLFGLKDGYGVIMVKKPDGQWSLPVLVNAGEASFGLQVGANKSETVFVINDEKIPRLLFNHRFNIGVDAVAVAGPKAAERERFSAEILKSPLLAYSKSTGLFVGATVKAGHISRSDQSNFILYNTRYAMPELLYSDWVPPPKEVQPLMDLVKRLSP
jgi:lipid-binding SYLF domain-containing protein